MEQYKHTKLMQWNAFSKIVTSYIESVHPDRYEIDDYSIQDHLNHYVANINKYDSEIPLCICIFAYALYCSITTNVSFEKFCNHVGMHIQQYVETQYGNFPDKTIAKFTPEKIQGKLEAYVDRIGKSARGEVDEIRDALKIAHFANYLFMMITMGDAQRTIELNERE